MTLLTDFGLPDRRRLRSGGRGRRARRQLHRRRCHIEPLESRQLLAANVFITEFVANSDGGLLDSDEDTSDWLEIHNPSSETVNLLGWSLSDDASRPDRWRFPYTDIEPGEYRVIFASGKDRAFDDQELRRDFHAVADGTFLVDLPEGSYGVRVTMGGEVVVRDNVDVHIQGQLVDTVSTREGEYFVETYAGDVTPDDGGQLAIRIHDTGGERARGAINALIITPQAGGDPVRFDFGEPGSPVASGFTGVTESDVYDASVGYGWQAGSDVRDQDRGQLSDELHTSFQLSTDGEPLGLFGPDGTVVHAYDPQYPPQRQGASYGVQQMRTDTLLVTEGSTARILVPSAANGGDELGDVPVRMPGGIAASADDDVGLVGLLGVDADDAVVRDRRRLG